MTATPRAVWDAIDAAKRNRIHATPAGDRLPGVPPWQAGRLLQPGPPWSWRSTDDPGRFEIWWHGESVAMLTVLPGHIERRAVLLDTIVNHLNKENTQ